MKTIALKWNAPGLTSAAAAISGSVFSPNNTQKIVLPANQPLSLQVEAGVPVVFRAQMPSGKVIQKTIKFSDDPAGVEVVLADPDTTGDPSFSLYSYLDAFKQSRPDPQRDLLSSLPQNSPRDFESIESTAEKSFRADTSSRAASYLSSLGNKDVWENLWLRVWSYEKNDTAPWHSHPAPVVPITFHAGSLIVQLGTLPPNRPCFLELGRNSGVSRFVAIPPIEGLQVVIRPSWNPKLFNASGGRTLQFVSTNDQYIRVQIALKYIQENAFSQAESLIEDMYSTMIEKVDNPFSAAVGGYFLLKFGESARIAQMARNFYQWHAWLPDSAIIYAWQLMSDESQDPDDEQHLRNVKDAIIEGVRRGVPIFTIGLRFLFEQLRQMQADAGANMASVTGFSDPVQYFAELLGACDQKQYLTTFFGMAPWYATRLFDSKFVVPTENRLPFSALNISWQFDPEDTRSPSKIGNAQRVAPASGRAQLTLRNAMPLTTERTSFTKDVEGRYLCNDINEVNQWKQVGGRPFDVIIVGGGTFGAALAEHIWFRQKQSGSGLRTLVIEAGLFTVPEHVQNTGIQGFADPADPFFLNENAPQPEPPRNEVWGLPWKSSIAFKGIAYAIGGRSVYWGGWSPRLLDAEVTNWPATTIADLKTRYFDESSRQIGVDQTNDFIFGELHHALRKRLFDNLSTVTAAIPLDNLPPSPLLKPGSDPAELLGIPPTGLTPKDLKNLLKLEAPLAVQARAPHAGFFPLNKFSTVPLLMKAARTAFFDSNGDDGRKEFMILPDTHVVGLRKVQTATGTWRITGVDTSNGFIDLAPGGVAVIALGTIESARLALLTFDGSNIGTMPRMGKNLMAHLRSNLVVRIPRGAIPGLSPLANELQTSALFLKCQAKRADGTPLGFFHLQISASGGGNSVGSEDELFRKVPDVDFFDQLRTSNDTHVAIAIRGVGEMAAADFNNPNSDPNRVDLATITDEYNVRRASVNLAASSRDNELWPIMDATMMQVANLFANGQPMQILQQNRDGLGTTHHEAGTLWMGTDPDKSVTDESGRLHFTENLYAAGPSLFPSLGSPNPMLTGIALARRTGDKIITPPPFTGDPGFEVLFDGMSIGQWRMSTIRNQPGRDNPGAFLVRRGALEAMPGTDLGLLWLNRPTPPRYVLRLEWMMTAPDDNSGVFVAFPNPEQQEYDNTAYVGVNFGFEIQIDELARPDNALIHRTAAVYAFKGPTDGPLNVRPVGEWNRYEITVDGADLTVALNGVVVNRFHFVGDAQSPQRGLPSTPQQPRYIGLQTHTGRVLFRRIQWAQL